MYKKVNYQSLEASQQLYILDLIESIERWDNALHRNLAMDKRESLMVIQSRELRNEQIAFLFNYLMTDTSAVSALKEFASHLSLDSLRFNRAALVSALELINDLDLTIKELQLKSDYPRLDIQQKQRNKQWFFIFDYLCELGGKDVFENSLSKLEMPSVA